MHTTKTNDGWRSSLESFKNQIKKLYNKRDTFFQFKESTSALNTFSIQYRIGGKDWIDLDLLLVNAQQSITNFLMNRRQTKVKVILSWLMEKVDLKSSQVIVKEAAFHSKTKVNLESTESYEKFLKMKETLEIVKWNKEFAGVRFIPPTIISMIKSLAYICIRTPGYLVPWGLHESWWMDTVGIRWTV